MQKMQFDAQKWNRKGSDFEHISDSQQMADLMLKLATREFTQTGKHPTSLLLLTSDEVHLVHTPLSKAENERHAVVNLSQKLGVELGAEAVGFVSECWFVQGQFDDPELVSAQINLNDQRVEMLLIMVSWSEQPTAARFMQIVRNEANKLPSLQPRPDLLKDGQPDGIFVFKRESSLDLSGRTAIHPFKSINLKG